MRKEIRIIVAYLLLIVLILTACTSKSTIKMSTENVILYDYEDPQVLYQNALEEDTLIVYSVSSRMFEVKESFEKDYPGLKIGRAHV